MHLSLSLSLSLSLFSRSLDLSLPLSLPLSIPPSSLSRCRTCARTLSPAGVLDRPSRKVFHFFSHFPPFLAGVLDRPSRNIFFLFPSHLQVYWIDLLDTKRTHSEENIFSLAGVLDRPFGHAGDHSPAILQPLRCLFQTIGFRPWGLGLGVLDLGFGV